MTLGDDLNYKTIFSKLKLYIFRKYSPISQYANGQLESHFFFFLIIIVSHALQMT